jgi:hypothetical protein
MVKPSILIYNKTKGNCIFGLARGALMKDALFLNAYPQWATSSCSHPSIHAGRERETAAQQAPQEKQICVKWCIVSTDRLSTALPCFFWGSVALR